MTPTTRCCIHILFDPVCSLITFKIFNSIILLGLACDYIQASKASKQAAQDAQTHDINSPTGHKRSKSLVENLHTLSRPTVRNAEEEYPMTPSFLTQTSLNSKLYLSNSTVSLTSVSLNEDFLDKKAPEVEVKQRKDKEKKPSPPLNEIDRYTMCSNRIT